MSEIVMGVTKRPSASMMGSAVSPRSIMSRKTFTTSSDSLTATMVLRQDTAWDRNGAIAAAFCARGEAANTTGRVGKRESVCDVIERAGFARSEVNGRSSLVLEPKLDDQHALQK